MLTYGNSHQIQRQCFVIVLMSHTMHTVMRCVQAKGQQLNILLSNKPKITYALVMCKIHRGVVVWQRLSAWRSIMITESTITCPFCGHQQQDTMPTDACWWFYVCPSCHKKLTPNTGDCCVFCSFGNVPCPPMQQKK